MIQIEVVKHFNEDAFSQGLAEGLAERLRSELSDVRCAEHGQRPTIRLSTAGVAQVVNDIQTEVDGCCDEVIDRVHQVVARVQDPDS